MADPADIVLIVEHPHGRVEIPLLAWIASGPPEGRPRLRPRAAYSRATGEALSLRVIPRGLRNTLAERLLVRLGLRRRPW